MSEKSNGNRDASILSGKSSSNNNRYASILSGKIQQRQHTSRPKHAIPPTPSYGLAGAEAPALLWTPPPGSGADADHGGVTMTSLTVAADLPCLPVLLRRAAYIAFVTSAADRPRMDESSTCRDDEEGGKKKTSFTAPPG